MPALGIAADTCTCTQEIGIDEEIQWLTASTERYFELLKDAKVKGYLFAQYNYVDDALKKQ
jgi:hypothetical protein